MSTDLSLQIKSTSSDNTENIGRIIGANLRGGEIIELKSDVGGGKTTFTRGLAAGAASNDDVASPTFTISRIYNAPHFVIHHFDFYRLSEPGIIAYELQEIINDKNIVIVIEWSDIVSNVLPANRLTIEFNQKGGDARDIRFTGPLTLAYLTKGLPV